MNMRKTLPLLVIASMMLSLIPSVMFASAAVTASINISTGNVGTKVIVSGTINSYNGRYSIGIDDDANTGNADLVLVASATASGYSFSKEITIPDAYFGARRIRVTDLDASGTPTADAYFTVETSYAVTKNYSTNYEGGGRGNPTTNLAFTTTIKGAPPAWTTKLQIRTTVNKPDGTQAFQITSANQTQTGFGTYSYVYTLWAKNTTVVAHGTYTVLVDSRYVTATWTNRAQTTFSVSLTDKTSYDRTQLVYIQVRAPADKSIDKITVTTPSGTEGADLLVVNLPVNQFLTTPMLVLTTVKDSALGTYTVKCYNGTTVLKSETFTVVVASLSVTQVSFTQTSVKDAGGAITSGLAVKRMQTVRLVFTVHYPNTNVLDNIDLTGLTVKAGYNGTVTSTMVLGALTDYAANQWTASWKIPKDAKLGTKYELWIEAAGVTDAYGNRGPTNIYRTNATFFTVAKGVFYPAQPVLNYPASTNTLSRTLTARALVDIRYADDSRLTATEFKAVNGTIVGGSGYTFQSVASDYSADAGLWIIKWKIPYNAAPAGGGTYQFQVAANDIEDIYGNTGNGGTAASAGTFGIAAATITVSGVTVDKTAVQSDEQITVTFSATYPSGDVVTTRNATGPIVTFYDGTGASVATKRAAYSSVTGKWSAAWIIPSGSTSGTYNATVRVNAVIDDATTPNTGPTAKKYANFEVSRVSLTDVLAASDAAKASSDLAQTKADAAKTAADTAATKADAAAASAADAKTAATAAGTKADAAAAAATAAGTAANAAKTSADAATAAATSAGTKADAAKTAADGAKTAADSAAAAANGLTTLVYAAIGASLIAALAAIVALMQISRKIA